MHGLPQSLPGHSVFLLLIELALLVGVARLGAVVVAPGLTVAALTEHLRLLIDPVFLPRPLLIVEELPRNATGKLPQQALLGFAEEQLRSNQSQ